MSRICDRATRPPTTDHLPHTSGPPLLSAGGFWVPASMVATLLVMAGLAGPVHADIHGRSNPQGALSGKTVVLSPGHGCSGTPGSVSWQRGTTPTTLPAHQQVREDIHTNQCAMELARMLANAGAVVFSCRERSYQTEEVIVDNRDAGYAETGTWGPQGGESTSHPGHYRTGYRFHGVSVTETAAARFEATLPVTGYYPVYIWYTPSPNRSTAALYRIHHQGGITEVAVNQQRYRPVWFFLGEYYFEASRPAAVELSNRGSDPQKYVVADAVRFGGGVGTTGQPRWREMAKLFTDYAGFKQASGIGDVTVRGYYSSWLAGNPASPSFDWRMLSIHTNAFKGGSRGCSTFSYSNSRPPAWSLGGTPPGGTRIHTPAL
ncbi:hypothetical protein ACFL59_10555, partial [Planctomycetota bacterium]